MVSLSVSVLLGGMRWYGLDDAFWMGFGGRMATSGGDA